MALCYRCGAPASEEAEFCPQCGTRLTSHNQRLDLLKIFGAISLSLSALVLGGLGACFLLVSVNGIKGYSPPSNDPTITTICIAVIAIAILFLFGCYKLMRSSPPRPLWLIALTGFGMILPALGVGAIFLDALAVSPVSAISASGRGPGASTIIILAAVVGTSVLLILTANKFFKRK